MPNKRKNAKSMKGKKSSAKAKASHSSFANVGRQIGNMIVPGIGGLVGSAAGSFISKITGRGAYKVSSNSIMSNQAPSFASNSTGMRICHREFVDDIKSSVAFSSKGYYINPGNGSLFPWLSGIAKNFESYEFHGLVFTYKTTCGSAVSSTVPSMGAVILATQYDVLKAQFGSKAEMEAYQYCTSTVPNDNMIHPIECSPKQIPIPHKYITTSTNPSQLDQDDDPRLHFQGRVEVAKQGQLSDNATLGELWVSYDISFFTPRAESSNSNTSIVAVRVGAASGSTSNQYSTSNVLCYSNKFWTNSYADTRVRSDGTFRLTTPGFYRLLAYVRNIGGSNIVVAWSSIGGYWQKNVNSTLTVPHMYPDSSIAATAVDHYDNGRCTMQSARVWSDGTLVVIAPWCTGSEVGLDVDILYIEVTYLGTDTVLRLDAPLSVDPPVSSSASSKEELNENPGSVATSSRERVGFPTVMKCTSASPTASSDSSLRQNRLTRQ